MILPLRENSENIPIFESNHIPKILGGLKQYFNQALPQLQGGVLCIKIWMLTYLSHQELMDEISWWLNQEQMNLWGAYIQSEGIKNVG